jgi:DUF1680 family protein
MSRNKKMKKHGLRKKLPYMLSVAMAANIASSFPAANMPVYAAGLEDSKQLDLKFEDDIVDSSKNGIAGTLNGTATYVPGQVGKALQLNGTNNYIDLGTSSLLQPENLTVSFWIKPDATLVGEQMIMWSKPDGAWSGEGWYLSALRDDVPLKLSTGTAVQEAYVSGNRSEFFPVGQWTHIAVTYDSATRNVAIYRNGMAQQVLYSTQGGEIIGNDTDHKYLGFNSPIYNGGFAKLNVDEFKIYSATASYAQVRNLYTTEGGVVDEQAIAEMDMNAIVLPSTTRNHLSLPLGGNNGSSIVWHSFNENVMSNSGVITIPEVDTQVTLQATITYGAVTLTKNFLVTVKPVVSISDPAMIKQFDMEQVDVTDPYYVNAFNKELAYIMSLDPNRLMAGFRTVAGLPKKAELYGGWEGEWSYLRGHTLGHYLTALAMAYKQTKSDPTLNAQIKTKIDYIVSELEACQDASDNGYLFATPETHFDVIEGKIQGPSWVPWYTMHKIIVGLVDLYNFAGSDDALEIASGLGDWTYNRTQTWDEATHTRVLNVEYGGMNDGLYELYKLTQNPNHLDAAHMFDEDSLFTPIVNGVDNLENRHANTQIPKIIGALNRYRTLGEEEADFYLKTAENFWEMVVKEHSYVTGGNSENEHFRAPGILDGTRNNVNDESCNTYNMLKLTRELFRITGDVKYSNFYERALINEVLASIHPETGMTTYFKAMGTGYFRVFGTEFDSFWCCTGTGMESFMKLDDSLYFHTDHDLYVNMYVSSTLDWADKGLKLTQEANMPQSDKATFTINEAPAGAVNMKFRSPDWVAAGQKVTVSVNGVATNVEAVNGYIDLDRVWQAGDKIELAFPMEVQVSRLPDNQDAAAFTYGPVVLSAGLGTERMEVIGHLASAKASIPEGVNIKDYILLNGGTVDDWIADIQSNLIKTEGKMEFTLRGTDEDNRLIFKPYYEMYEERYGIYFYLTALDSETYQRNIIVKKEANKKANATIDEVQITNDQHELAHNLQGNSSGGSYGNYQYRHGYGANTGDAWLSYDMTVNPDLTNYISAKYYSGDEGRTFNVYVDGVLLKEETVQAKNPVQFYDVKYEIPANLVQGKTKVTVKFANRGSSHMGGIFGTVSILKDYDNNANLQSVKVNGTAAAVHNNVYTGTVPKSSTEAVIDFNPTNPNALVYVNDVLIDDTVDRKVALTGDTTSLNVRVVAEDGITENSFTVSLNKDEDDSAVPVESVSMTGASGSLKVNEQRTVSATINPVSATSPVYQWEASGDIGIVGDSDKATVAIKGTKTGKGTLKLTVTAGGVAKSAETEITVVASDSGNGGDTGNGGGSGTTAPGNESNKVDIQINGKGEGFASLHKSVRNGQNVMTVTLDKQKLGQSLAAAADRPVVTIHVYDGSEVVIGQLTAQNVKELQEKNAVLDLRIDKVAYTIPVQSIDLNALSAAAGGSAKLDDIVLQFQIAIPTAAKVQAVEEAATKGNFQIVIPPVEFSLNALFNGETIKVPKFNTYVERTLEILEGIDPAAIATAIVIEEDGAVRHVPTQVVKLDGKWYAKVKSLTNSTYAVISNPVAFKDVANHWAKDSVNDLASRMIVSGEGDGHFKPDASITRAEFAAIIVRGLGLELEESQTNFKDVNASAWYNGFVTAAQSYGLINGFNDGTFRPNDTITREQAMVILAKAMELTGLKAKLASQATSEALTPFRDAGKVSNWATSAVRDSVQAGIVSGRSGNALAPKANITRAEAAKIVQLLLQKSELI